MHGTCSSMMLLLLACAAAAGCSVNASHPYATADIPLLEDARFTSANARTGVWTPSKFQRAGGEGIYFLDHYDRAKIPVLFIHGLYGSPRNFSYLLTHLDRNRFQPWLYYYASGANLTGIAERLLNEIDSLCAYYQVRSFVIVAHSMGGLVARDVLLRSSRLERTAVPLLITLSTPWGGHRAAAVGARFLPRAVEAWHDLAFRSAYLEALFQTSSGVHRHLPDGTEHHLFASIGPRTDRGANASDGAVSVASQLREQAWIDAYRVYRFDETHVGILNSPGVADSINRVLTTVLTSPR
jgi:pimeloyl-ACP methyl ester carboxylesterase